MVILDANAVLRFILGDNEQMAGETKLVISENNCFIPTEVIAEIVYVLSGFYEIPRGEVCAALLSFLSNETISCSDFTVVKTGLAVFAETTLDFVDCLLVSYSRTGYEIFTFDKKLRRKLEGETR
jgi:predicted nucleic-acid-binding protein